MRYFPGEYEIIPNGVLIPELGRPGRAGEPCRLHRQARSAQGDGGCAARPGRRCTRGRARGCASSARIRFGCGSRWRDSACPGDGIDSLGPIDDDSLSQELKTAKALAAPSLGGESFGMVLTRAFACATPAVASDIDGYREVMAPGTGDRGAAG